VLRGNHPARIDEKGRLKVPNGFRTLVEAHYGPELFVTSVSGEYARLYPMTVWLEIERKLAAAPSTNPSKLRFLDRVNFFGQAVTLDKQGRVLIPQILRETAAMTGEVCVLGQQDYLTVWNMKRLQEKLEKEPFTDEDGRVLSELGI
jgi:MraZ protein